MPQSSRIFVRNRAIGYVSNHIPCVTRYIKTRQSSVIVTCVGRCFHTYDTNHLTLLTVSDATEEEITCLAADSRVTFTACGPNVYAWRRGTVIHNSYIGHKKSVHLILPFGPHLITVDEENLLKVWDRGTAELFLELTFDINTFKLTTINHPSTYINKILLGSEQGRMQLWNIKTSKLIYTFDGWDSPISVLEQAPALDVTAIGLVSGRIILHNLKFDETIMEFMQDWGVVTSISFRTDGPPIMATGTTVGHIVLWDLEEKKVASQILEAHSDVIGTVKFLPNEPLMISSSVDNSLKMWIFDQTDGSGRLLRLREGHGSQPTHIRYHGNSGYYIMSSGGDSSLRVFSTINETYNYSLGKARFHKVSAKKKKHLFDRILMPPIVEFTSEDTRDKEWDSIAAIHLGLPLVTTWSFHKRKMGDLKLLPERFAKKTRASLKVVATCIQLTSCGNFVIVGYSSGHIDRFNIQSGIHRCQYGIPKAHKSAIRGVVSDSLNQLVISGSGKGIIKFWPFKGSVHGNICEKYVAQMNVEEPICFFRYHKESSLLAAVLEDYKIVLVDVETKRIVRRLEGHSGQITDATFSPDSRWLISSSMDCTIRTWDIPNSVLVDAFKVESPCTCLALSPTGHLLSTIHVNNLGIYLWSNKTLYCEVSLGAITSDEIPSLALPASRGKEEVIQLDKDDDQDLAQMDTQKKDYTSPQQIEDLITLSGLPTSRWLNLLDLDVIRRKNKKHDYELDKKKAPFFLPTLPTLGGLKFDLTVPMTLDEESLKSLEAVKLARFKNYTAFGLLLEKTAETNDFSPVIDKLKSFGSSYIDFEITSMALETQGSETLLVQFMKMLVFMMSSHRDFELAQSYLALFLKVHGGTISSNGKLLSCLKELQAVQEESWNKIQHDFMFILSVIDAQKKF